MKATEAVLLTLCMPCCMLIVNSGIKLLNYCTLQDIMCFLYSTSNQLGCRQYWISELFEDLLYLLNWLVGCSYSHKRGLLCEVCQLVLLPSLLFLLSLTLTYTHTLLLQTKYEYMNLLSFPKYNNIIKQLSYLARKQIHGMILI